MSAADDRLVLEEMLYPSALSHCPNLAYVGLRVALVPCLQEGGREGKGRDLQLHHHLLLNSNKMVLIVNHEYLQLLPFLCGESINLSVAGAYYHISTTLRDSLCCSAQLFLSVAWFGWVTVDFKWV